MADDLLLHAAFGTPERSLAAWNEWSSRRDLGSLDAAHTRLFPAVYRSLRACGIADASIAPAVKEVARSLFVRTELLLREAAGTIEHLRPHGLDPILLKGAALVAGGYMESSARPMSDFDLLVRPSEVHDAASLLGRAGWSESERIDVKLMRHRHATLFRKPEHGCDVHWRLLWESHDLLSDERVRAAAETVSLRGVQVFVPRPEHLLFLVIIHGTRAIHPAVRWIGDALAILKARARDFDWDLFVQEADARGFAFPAGDALSYLARNFGATVPATILRSLQARRTPLGCRSTYFVDPLRPVGRWRAHAASLVMLSLRRPAHLPLRERILWIPQSLRYGLGVRVEQLPFMFVRSMVRKLRRG